MERVGVADGAVGDEPAHGTLLEAEELDVAPDRLPRPHARHDQHLRPSASPATYACCAFIAPPSACYQHDQRDLPNRWKWVCGSVSAARDRSHFSTITSLGPHFSNASYSGELAPAGLSAPISGRCGTKRTVTARPTIFMPLPSGLPARAG